MHALQLLLRTSKRVRQPASLGTYDFVHSIAAMLQCKEDHMQSVFASSPSAASVKAWSSSSVVSRAPAQSTTSVFVSAGQAHLRYKSTRLLNCADLSY